MSVCLLVFCICESVTDVGCSELMAAAATASETLRVAKRQLAARYSGMSGTMSPLTSAVTPDHRVYRKRKYAADDDDTLRNKKTLNFARVRQTRNACELCAYFIYLKKKNRSAFVLVLHPVYPHGSYRNCI